MATVRSFEALVLAAGAGARFGGGKLLAPWRGGMLIDGALRAAFEAPVRAVRVVVGADAEQVEHAAHRFAESLGETERLRIVPASDHAEGMGASLRAGARDLPDDAAGVVVFLGDMPDLSSGLAASLIEAVAAGAPAAAPVFAGRRGHPVAFSATLFADLQRASGDEGARDLLRSLGARLALVVSNDPGVLLDIDTPADLDCARKR